MAFGCLRAPPDALAGRRVLQREGVQRLAQVAAAALQPRDLGQQHSAGAADAHRHEALHDRGAIALGELQAALVGSRPL